MHGKLMNVISLTPKLQFSIGNFCRWILHRRLGKDDGNRIMSHKLNSSSTQARRDYSEMIWSHKNNLRSLGESPRMWLLLWPTRFSIIKTSAGRKMCKVRLVGRMIYDLFTNNHRTLGKRFSSAVCSSVLWQIFMFHEKLVPTKNVVEKTRKIFSLGLGCVRRRTWLHDEHSTITSDSLTKFPISSRCFHKTFLSHHGNDFLTSPVIIKLQLGET